MISPLNWGLGHATRCIPVARSLIELGHNVSIGGDGPGFSVLKERFPAVDHVSIPSASIRYGKGLFFIPVLASQLPSFLKNIKMENRLLDKIIEERHFDLIISDNRYGLFNKKTKNVIITHQLMVKAPGPLFFTEPFMQDFIANRLSRFDHVLIPDSPGADNFSGDLSHKYNTNNKIIFAGILSRFSNAAPFDIAGKKYDLLFINSGPEPHRTILEKILTQQIRNTELKAAVLMGLPQKQLQKSEGNIDYFSHINETDFLNLVSVSEHIIARGGYSTIMDLVALNRKAVLIPTPGQTEQEYLAKHLHNAGQFVFEKQSDFSVGKAIAKLEKTVLPIRINSNDLLTSALEKITC